MPVVGQGSVDEAWEPLNASTGQITQNNAITAYIENLAKMENCGEGIIDQNGLVSKGDLCFQKSTYLYFVKKYDIYPYAEENELLSNWGDSWTQREIARRMIEEEVTQLEKHWYTSVVVRKLGLPTYD